MQLIKSAFLVLFSPKNIIVYSIVSLKNHVYKDNTRSCYRKSDKLKIQVLIHILHLSFVNIDAILTS